MGGFIFVVVVVLILFSCSDGQDGDYFPYRMKGLDVYVYDNLEGKEHFAGHIKARYWDRKEALATCADYAEVTARSNQLKDWGYVCCTVTSSSSCVTKVR